MTRIAPAEDVRRARLAGQTSQQVFDVLLRTAAEPGSVRTLPAELIEGPRGLDRHPVLWAPLALADVGVAVNVDDDPDSPHAALLAAATGAEIVALDDAWLVVFHEPAPDRVERIGIGSAFAPEDGARVFVAVDEIASGTPASPSDPGRCLRGPGILGTQCLRFGAVDNAASELLDHIGRSTGPFPAGFDTWFVDRAGRVTAVPRSTTVEPQLCETEGAH